jgi:hypothetical protein
LFQIHSTELRRDPCATFGEVAGVLPAEGDEADADGAQEIEFVEGIRDASHGVGVDGEFDALEKAGRREKGERRRDRADFGDESFSKGEEDVAVLVGVLEDGVAEVILQAPTGGDDDFVVAIERFVGGDEVEDGGGGIFDF